MTGVPLNLSVDPAASQAEGAEPSHSALTLAVVITCFNYAEYVAQAIASVTSQNCAACELVVIDDGSSDGSWDVISGLGVTAYRIENGGQRAACLYGLDRTTAPFVLFLDADDALKPGALDAIIAALDPGVSKLQFGLTRIDARGNVLDADRAVASAFRSGPELVRRVLQTGVYATPPTSGNVFRRDLCELLREAAYDSAVDGVILFAAPFYGDVVGLPDELGLYRIHHRNDSGLGRGLDASSLRRDIDRFVLRMSHLRAVLQARGIAGEGAAQQLARTQDTFFYLERSFCLAIASGRRPGVGHLLRLLDGLWREYLPVRTKCVMMLFFMLTMLTPNVRAKDLLAYRFNAGQRSMRRLLTTILRGSG